VLVFFLPTPSSKINSLWAIQTHNQLLPYGEPIVLTDAILTLKILTCSVLSTWAYSENNADYTYRLFVCKSKARCEDGTGSCDSLHRSYYQQFQSKKHCEVEELCHIKRSLCPYISGSSCHYLRPTYRHTTDQKYVLTDFLVLWFSPRGR
jgi:hypothetical protein